MNDIFDPRSTSAPRDSPALPTPTRQRWQPLRLGLVELFHYDSEEFWFRDGHLLLRGNNGTGKSKVLSLTLPFLLDAQLKLVAHRARRRQRQEDGVEPADEQLRPAHRLCLDRVRPRRRRRHAALSDARRGPVGGGGTPAGGQLVLHAGGRRRRPAHQPGSLADERPARRADAGSACATRSNGRGQVFDTAASYRRAVDERLFHLGHQALRRADGYADPAAPAAAVEEARRSRRSRTR